MVLFFSVVMVFSGVVNSWCFRKLWNLCIFVNRCICLVVLMVWVELFGLIDCVCGYLLFSVFSSVS